MGETLDQNQLLYDPMTVANVGVNVSTFRSGMVMGKPMETVKGKRPHSQYLPRNSLHVNIDLTINFSTYRGAQWCYVDNDIGSGYSTCGDQTRSSHFSGSTWSFQACRTPALHHSACRYCQGRRIIAFQNNAFQPRPTYTRQYFTWNFGPWKFDTKRLYMKQSFLISYYILYC